jgi:hypothetical protein
MKVVSMGFLAALGNGNIGVEGSKQVRAPDTRARKNQQFLETWFENNCKTGDGVDAVRPSRCENKFVRYMNELEKLKSSFDKCGFFDENVPNGGPRPSSNHRRRRDDYGDDYYYEDSVLIDTDLFEMTNEDIEELDAYDDNAGNEAGTEDYWSYMADYWSDYQETVTATESSTDEDNGKIRTASDLKKLEERAFSKDPARAHRQLVNAMKQYVKRFLDDCKAPEDKLKRLTKVYRNAASLHEFIVNIIAEKYKRLDARSSRNRL